MQKINKQTNVYSLNKQKQIETMEKMNKWANRQIRIKVTLSYS